MFYSCAKVNDILSVIVLHEMFVKGEKAKRYRRNDMIDLVKRARTKLVFLDSDFEIYHLLNVLMLAVDN